MKTQREYYEVVAGDAHDEIAVIYTGQDLLLRPILSRMTTANATFCVTSRKTCRPTKTSPSLRWSAIFFAPECRKLFQVMKSPGPVCRTV
jgi:hypothetical protein